MDMLPDGIDVAKLGGPVDGQGSKHEAVEENPDPNASNAAERENQNAAQCQEW
jgi:hypothetical protein